MLIVITLIIASIIALAPVLLIAFAPTFEPDYRLLPMLNSEELIRAVQEKAKTDLAFSKKRGNGLPLKHIRATVRKAYRIVNGKDARGERLLEHEKILLNDYYKMDEIIETLWAEDFSSLPHESGYPRVCSLCSLVVKSLGGMLTREALIDAVEEYNRINPLSFPEIASLPSAVLYATVELCACYALRILNSNEKKNKGREDAKNGRINLSLINSPSYLTGILERADDKLKKEIYSLCTDNGISVKEREALVLDNAALYSATLSSAVKTLFTLQKWLNDKLVISLTPSAKILEEDEVFARSTDLTKLTCLQLAYEKSRKLKTGECAVATMISQKAKREGTDISRYLYPKERGKIAQWLHIIVRFLLCFSLCFTVYLLAPVQKIIVTLFSFPLSLALSTEILDAVETKFLKLYPMPKIVTSEGANITCTRLIANKEEAIDAVRNLSCVALSNPNKSHSYTLLVDLPTKKRETDEGDEEIIQTLTREISKLDGSFNLLIRKRVKCGNEYRGYERKRGALLALNGLILRNEREPFRIIVGDTYKKEFVIALDSDTLLDCADELVGAITHPLQRNCAVLSLNMKSTPRSKNATLFSRVFADASGLDGYSRPCSNLPSRLFGAGNFTGKGIYRVKEFDERVGNAFPDEKILSHDYIEGAFSRCKNCDESALDAFPSTPSAHLLRALRWLRGDWQLLPYLLPVVKDREGKWRKNPVPVIGIWHISVNQMYGLLPVYSMILLILSAFFGSFPALIVVFYYLAKILLAIPLIKYSVKEFFKTAFQVLYSLSLLPVHAIYNAYSVILTVVRLIRSKNLLCWKTSAHERDSIDFTLPLFTVAFVLFIINLFFAKGLTLFLLCALFVIASPLTLLLSEKSKRAAVSPSFSAVLSLVMQKTWRYYDELCTKEHSFLPPDNYDERENFGCALRTSPTDIGMALSSCYCALKADIISRERAEQFISNIIGTLTKAEKWKGNLYNWYDITTLKPLPPRYCSFVDSGNLLVSLHLVKEIASESTKADIETLIKNTDLSAFYDEKSSLAHIGYNESENCFDGHYDLVASESSIAYLLGICSGDLPRKCWNALSHRTLYYGGNILASWTGGAFEYLLSPQFFDYQAGTEYAKSAALSVKAQITYAKRKGYPVFGISESQYRSYHDNGDYKYKALGVPNIALSSSAEKGTLSPYGALLSVKYAPWATEAVLSYYIEKGMLGKYGLYEAFDGQPIKTFMAHHQGMIMLAITNYLYENAIVESLRENALFRSAELLLSRPPKIKIAKRKIVERNDKKCNQNEEIELFDCKNSRPCLYENGEYRIVIDQNGNGFSSFRGINISAKREGTGMLVFARTSDGESNLTRNSTVSFYSTHARFTKNAGKYYSEVKARPLWGGAGEEREVTVRNKTDEPLTLSLRSYFEIALGKEEDNIAHREYNNMFVLTQESRKPHALIAKRGGAHLAHFVVGADNPVYESSRANFFSRHATVRFGAVLDPIASARVTITLSPKETRTLHFYTLVDGSEQKLLSRLALVKTYGYCERISFAPYALEPLAIKLYSLIDKAVGTYKDNSVAGEFDTTAPLVALRVSRYTPERTRRYLNALTACARFGARFNLALIYNDREGYFKTESRLLTEEIERCGIKNCPTVLAVKQINGLDREEDAKNILNNCVDLYGEDEFYEIAPSIRLKPLPALPLVAPRLILPRGRGGFTEDGGYYLDITKAPAPKPWSNIVANESFGTLVTDSGGGFTYALNSRENKLTRWSNDAVLDIPSESVLIYERSRIWSVTRNPVTVNANYAVHFHRGYTEHECSYNATFARLTQFVGKGLSKYYKLTLKNQGNEIREYAVALAIDTVLGSHQRYTSHSLIGRVEGNRLYMKNSVSGEEAYIDCTQALESYAFNKSVTLDGEGNIARLTNLNGEIKGSSLIYSVSLTVAPEQSKEITFCLCYGGVETSLDATGEIFEDNKKRHTTLSPVLIDSGYLPLDLLYGWLPVQTLDCRFFARSGFYQSGGAYGFRDQLQDCLAVVYFSPALAREHILRAAAHQFESGDVQHWWHAPAIGVRTRFCDDRLFLPLVTAEYIRITGDREILSERVPFLRDIKLPKNQKSVYAPCEQTAYKTALIDHCIKAIDSTALSDKGLVLMGGGDWNDAMDEVGDKGKGTSTFATELLYLVLQKLIPLVDGEKKNEYARLSVRLNSAVEGEWEGDRYHRATMDDGTVLGSKYSKECKIDLLTQAFAVLSGIAEGDRARVALSTALDNLYDEENKIVKLLSPPFKEIRAGYINDYPSGIRENGGQYSHAVVWFIMALIKTCETERAWELFKALNPVERSASEREMLRYKTEPFAMTADIYAYERAGEGGWSWYTGTAGWTYKLITECFFGLNFQGDSLTLSPSLPKEIKHSTVKIKRNECSISLKIDNTAVRGEWTLTVDGVTYGTPKLKLSSSLNGREITLKRVERTN